MSIPSINLSALPAPSRQRKEGPSQSIESIFAKYKSLLKLNDKQIEKLLSLKNKNEYIFTYQNIGFIYEVFSMIRSLGFDETYRFLTTTTFDSKIISSKKIFESDIFERERTTYQIDISRLRDEFQVKAKGLVKCKRCQSQNTENMNNDRQRGGDEGMIYRVRCNDCNHTWTEGA
jgi:DNA-directed RNA polymerase subunit M/transcription elongation factor TFIIS